ncbi:uncharacterized protein MYCFIDRAFT_180696 [Pseudocercospora fijiensis CIRAD86]|uniref:Uncharacterized protein n=1 Tax=Pseudocercospora fijiensis (strain CIRAD86) TaxID=383855 RepID=M3AHX0_PSEFD|nr:uncharacterized protein MYCFIDRAFT_180696 [Pseudocercospora fijiensis CIRAD86]EME76793.1 hypothetical protein MYCFIDRAFT_180696 [Pseudocercospora fijiensis CIRAD86]
MPPTPSHPPPHDSYHNYSSTLSAFYAHNPSPSSPTPTDSLFSLPTIHHKLQERFFQHLDTAILSRLHFLVEQQSSSHRTFPLPPIFGIFQKEIKIRCDLQQARRGRQDSEQEDDVELRKTSFAIRHVEKFVGGIWYPDDEEGEEEKKVGNDALTLASGERIFHFYGWVKRFWTEEGDQSGVQKEELWGRWMREERVGREWLEMVMEGEGDMRNDGGEEEDIEDEEDEEEEEETQDIGLSFRECVETFLLNWDGNRGGGRMIMMMITGRTWEMIMGG